MIKYLKVRNILLFFRTIFFVKNWIDYFMDMFGVISKKHVIYRTRDGLKYLARTKTTDRSIVNSVAIQDEYQLEQLGLQNATIIDLGGQNGYFSVFASKYAKEIFTFEPIPENYNNILKNVQLNHLEHIVKPVNLAVSDKEEKIKIYLSNNTGGHSIYYGASGQFHEISTTTLPNIFDDNHIEHCHLLKMDIEGSEYNILYSLPDEYFSKIDHIRMEVHEIDKEQNNHRCLINYLKQKNYDIIFFENHILFAKKQALLK